MPTATSGSTTSWPVAPPCSATPIRRCRRPSRASSASSAVVTLPHMLEIKVTADAVRHDSVRRDGAVRQARIGQLHRGRSYRAPAHGAQEGAVQRLPRLARLVRGDAPAEAGESVAASGAVPVRPQRHRRPSTPPSRRHRGEIAAVMVEPAAQAATLDDATAAADPVFLRHVADVCREQGAVLIFDEIVTGFRYPGGSVQRATGRDSRPRLLREGVERRHAAVSARRSTGRHAVVAGRRLHADVPGRGLFARRGGGSAGDPSTRGCPGEDRRHRARAEGRDQRRQSRHGRRMAN